MTRTLLAMGYGVSILALSFGVLVAMVGFTSDVGPASGLQGLAIVGTGAAVAVLLWVVQSKGRPE